MLWIIQSFSTCCIVGYHSGSTYILLLCKSKTGKKWLHIFPMAAKNTLPSGEMLPPRRWKLTFHRSRRNQVVLFWPVEYKLRSHTLSHFSFITTLVAYVNISLNNLFIWLAWNVKSTIIVFVELYIRGRKFSRFSNLPNLK